MNMHSRGYQDDFRKSFFRRPSFRVQIKSWRKSNLGNYIEYLMIVQVLEGPRRTWYSIRRYTDFVKLHESLLPVMKVQMSLNSPQLAVRNESSSAIPVLPAKIMREDDQSLRERKAQLEDYINKTI